MIPGEVLPGDGSIELNHGRPIRLLVQNMADRPLRVGSHFHFAEVNAGLEPDREAAWGQRLDVATSNQAFDRGSHRCEARRARPYSCDTNHRGLPGRLAGQWPVPVESCWCREACGAGSTNAALLRTARAVAPESVVAVFFEGANDLPHFNPDLDTEPLHPAVVGLRAGIRSADCLLISTPEYAGALPASLKNVLEWAVGDGQAGSIYEKPAAWVNVSASPTGRPTLTSLWARCSVTSTLRSSKLPVSPSR